MMDCESLFQRYEISTVTTSISAKYSDINAHAKNTLRE